MLVTPSGIVIPVRLVQSPKARGPMLVTDLPSMATGMISAPDAFSSQPVIVIASPTVSYLKGPLTDTASVGLVSATGSSG